VNNNYPPTLLDIPFSGSAVMDLGVILNSYLGLRSGTALYNEQYVTGTKYMKTLRIAPKTPKPQNPTSLFNQ